MIAAHALDEELELVVVAAQRRDVAANVVLGLEFLAQVGMEGLALQGIDGQAARVIDDGGALELDVEAGVEGIVGRIVPARFDAHAHVVAVAVDGVDLLDEAVGVAAGLRLHALGIAQQVAHEVHVVHVHVHGHAAAVFRAQQPALAGPLRQGAEAVELAAEEAAIGARRADLLEPAVFAPEADHLTHLHLGARFALGGQKLVELLVADAGGLFEEHGAPLVHGGNGVRGVQLRGQADVDHVDVRLFNERHA